MMSWQQRWQLMLIVLGTLVAGYLTLLHYDSQVPLVCSNHGFIDCENVLTSPESTWFGIPVSGYGLIWFIGYGLIVLFRRGSVWLRRLMAMVGAATVLYLVYVEFVVLGTVCLWCSSLHLLILSLLAMELVQWMAWKNEVAEGISSPGMQLRSSRKSSDHSETL